MLNFARLAAVAAVATIASANAASAVVVGYTEGLRPVENLLGTMDPTTAITPPDVSASAPGFDLNTDLGGPLNFGDEIELYGRIVGSEDFYQFSSDAPWLVEFIADGLVADGGSPEKTVTFSIFDSMNALVDSVTLDSPIPAGPLMGVFDPGMYTFVVDGTASFADALYDVRFRAVPLPAALPMLLSALGGMVYMRRRRGAA
jgi:hypothetical protein